MTLASAGHAGKPDSIRLATTSDIERLVDLEQRCFTGDRLSRRSFRRFLTGDTAPLLIAEHGYLLLLTRRGSKVARIYSVAVAPEARGQGLGRRLVERAEQLARARGCEHMHLEVRVDNDAAIGLYGSLGYVAQRELPGYYEDGQAGRRYRKPLTDLREPSSTRARAPRGTGQHGTGARA